MARTIIFGDIHGCLDEWQELIKKINPSRSDTLISVGDLICKGPHSRKTLDFAMQLPNLKCVTGNHELHFLKAWKSGKIDTLLKDYQKDVVCQLGKDFDRYMKWISTWPYYLDLEDCIIIHGGIRSGVPLEKQPHEELCNLRNLEDGTPWHSSYREKKLIVYGHWAKQGLCVKENSVGLDSGCVYGKQLSALILPEKKIVQVNAKQAYQTIESKKN